jgi:hypothetical protein
MKPWILASIALNACGGGGDRPAASADDAEVSAQDEQAAPSAGGDGAEAAAGGSAEPGLPNQCARQDGEVCEPNEKFVLALCNHDYPTVTLSLFASGTPWTRAYMRVETRAVNASGGGSSNDMLKVDEEVLVLRKRGAATPGGMTVSGADGSYDVLRWDGACVTVHPSEVSFEAPQDVKNARIIWKRLEIATRDKLQEDEVVYKAYVQHKKTCKGISFGEVSKDCVKADAELSRTIAERVRSLSDLPRPNKLPEL